MAIALYMDHHVPRAITVGLRLRGVDIITAYEDEAADLEDADLLNRASELSRVLFTQDDDLLMEAHGRQQEGQPFAGVVYAHQLRVSIGKCIQDLEIIAKAGEPEDLAIRSRFSRCDPPGRISADASVLRNDVDPCSQLAKGAAKTACGL